MSNAGHIPAHNHWARGPLAGLLSWLIPGLGHIYLGHRGRGLVLLVVVTATFWTGVAIGSVQATVDPGERKLWFLAQLGTGGNAIAAYGLQRRASARQAEVGEAATASSWLGVEVGVNYSGIAGLLNLLVILDALSRAEPVFGRRRPLGRRREGSP